jgi:hypothetical protein
MSYAQWRISCTIFLVNLGIVLIFVLGFYLGVSDRVSLFVASVLSSSFTASALVWFSNFLKCVWYSTYFTEQCVYAVA